MRGPFCLQFRSLHRSFTRTFDRQTQDVVPDDLGATLAAHRESNLRARIHKYDTNPDKRRNNISLEDGTRMAEAKARKRAARASHNRHFLRLRSSTDASQVEDVVDTTVADDADDAESEPQQLPSAKVTRLREKQEADDGNAAMAYGSYVPTLTYRDQHRFDPYTAGILSEPIDGGEKYCVLLRLQKHMLTLSRLHRLVHQFTQWIKLTDFETTARQRLINALSMQLHQRAINVQFELGGSMATGLATPLSDIDIACSVTDEEAPLKKGDITRDAIGMLSTLKKATSQIPQMKQQFIVRAARVPVLYMKHMPSNTEFHFAATPVSKRQHLLITSWLEEFPQLRPLYLLVKTTLNVRGLSDPATGGLGSYALVCMIVAFLRMANKTKFDDLTSCLWEFLDFYAHFNTRVNCIAVEGGSIFKKRGSHETRSAALQEVIDQHEIFYWQQQLAMINGRQPWLLCLQDPNDFSEDLGKGCHRIMDIRMTFRVLSQRLRSWLEGTPERQQDDPFRPFFGKMLGLVRDRRSHFMLWGRRLGTVDTTSLSFL